MTKKPEKKSPDKEAWRTGLLTHRIYMRKLYKRPETTLQGLAKMLSEREKAKAAEEQSEVEAAIDCES